MPHHKQVAAPQTTLLSILSLLSLIVPRAWKNGYTLPCTKCQGKSATHFVYFWSRKILPYTHLEATPYIPQQGRSLHIWSSSLSGCYKNKYTIQFLWMACMSRFATAILSGETELALGTARVMLWAFCSCVVHTYWEQCSYTKSMSLSPLC